jgi:hypothetical protein
MCKVMDRVLKESERQRGFALTMEAWLRNGIDKCQGLGPRVPQPLVTAQNSEYNGFPPAAKD